jgi:tetratricopeptide (TPR) repeat protein
MDDLAGLDWSKSTGSQKPSSANYTSNTSFSGLKPTPPASGRATPLPNIASNPPSKPHTPANDSFANLVSWSSNPSNAALSLQEQQKRLAEVKQQQQKTQAKTVQDQFGGADDAVWNNLGSGRGTPTLESQKNGKLASSSVQQDEEDIFAAFNASKATESSRNVPGRMQKPPAAGRHTPLPQDDDDPFGLSEFQQREVRRAQTTSTIAEDDDDDDVLGLLGKPVDRSRRRPDLEDAEPANPPESTHPQDRAVAELVDMGFPVDKARHALETTESGTDLQAAISYLLNAAHQEGRERSRNRDAPRNGHKEDPPPRGRGGRVQQSSRRHVEDDEGPVMQRKQQQQVEKDPTQLAAEFGSNFLKSANSFWKQSTKKVQQAVQEFNSDSEGGGQPKWMRDAERTNHDQQPEGEAAGTRRRRSSAGKRKEQDVTDEAMMLESQRPTPPPRPAPRRQEPRFDSSADTSRDHSPAVPSRLRESSSPQPAFLRQQQARPSPQPPPSRSSLNRQANEEQAAQAYVSSARRRKPAVPAAPSASEPDLFDTSAKATPPQRPASSRPAQPPPKPAPVASRPPPPKRTVPTISPLSLKASHTAREAGNTHFKRGDYSSAHESYATSLKHLPPTHPLILVLLTNHALTALKVGEPKLAIADCDTAIALIGVSRGEAETVDLLTQDGAAPKPMRDYYGKALMRKAEALEQMEKWTEAAAVWKEAVEAGHGGATSMQGRLRAEKAANPAATAAVRSRPGPPNAAATAGSRAVPTRPRPKPAAVVPSGDSAAVTRLRASNAAADKADDEKFALADQVDARVGAWKNGKQDNLRALLGSLDTVLWEGANWKKIGMADLVLPGKVKVQYMKGIGKVHPDKASFSFLFPYMYCVLRCSMDAVVCVGFV